MRLLIADLVTELEPRYEKQNGWRSRSAMRATVRRIFG